MALTIDATKRIFDLLDDDEQIALCAFDTVVDILGDLKPKGQIDRDGLFARLDTVHPRGGTDFGPGLSTAISMLKTSATPGRNQRIIFLTDAIPTIGSSPAGIRDLTEAAFVESGGLIGVTYVGIGLSFDAGICAELTAAHGTSVYSASNTAELDALVTAEFNYLVSPIAFDIHIEVSSSEYAITEVFGGDADCVRGAASMDFRTMTASAVGPNGVKGGALIIHLDPIGSAGGGGGASVHIAIEWTPSEGGRGRKEEDYFLNVETLPLTEKAFALSVYYRTLRSVLPHESGKSTFTAEEGSILRRLLGFLNSRSAEIVAALHSEIEIVGDLLGFEEGSVSQ
jgi:Ca-activated chloride channel family protein